MTKDCDNCKHYHEICPAWCPDESGFPEWQPRTNADRVRDMSDEELKEVLMRFSRTDGKLSEEEVIEWMERTDDEQDSGS